MKKSWPVWRFTLPSRNGNLARRVNLLIEPPFGSRVNTNTHARTHARTHPRTQVNIVPLNINIFNISAFLNRIFDDLLRIERERSFQ